MAGHSHDGIDTAPIPVLHHVVHDGLRDLLSGHFGAALRELLHCWTKDREGVSFRWLSHCKTAVCTSVLMASPENPSSPFSPADPRPVIATTTASSSRLFVTVPQVVIFTGSDLAAASGKSKIRCSSAAQTCWLMALSRRRVFMLWKGEVLEWRLPRSHSLLHSLTHSLF